MKSKLTSFLIFACLYCQAQSINPINVIPPSPTSREFDKYITYNVSLSNGIPEISIPLYEISLGNSSIPIALKYHASGIKFEQQSGEVGLGWVLDPGCRVSRTIYGRPDEFFDKPTSPNPSADFTTNQARDYYLAQFEDLGMSYPPGASRLDGEFDLFTYSLPSINGSFVIGDRQLNKIRQISYTNSSIILNRSTDRSIAYFDIKDGNGVSYRLGKNLSENKSFLERNPNYTSAPSSWMLTDMVDQLGNYARFNYMDYTESDPVWFKKSLLIHQGGNGGNIGEERSFAYLNYIPANSLRYEVKRMSSIDTRDQLLTFFRANTTGILDSITVRRNDSNDLLKTIRFVYASAPGRNFLKSVTISGADGSIVKVYKFDYYNQEFSGSIDGNFIPDYWGYYKQSANSQYYFPNFDDVNYLATSPGSNDFFFQIKNPIYDGLNMVDRNSSSAAPNFFSLKKITYPTGGSTEYEYESNKYNGYRDDRSGTSDKFVGIRIKRISSNDNVKTETLINEYKYGINESGFGTVEADIADKRYFAKENLFLQTDAVYNNTIPFLETTYQTTIGGDMSVFSGAPVSYDQVSEYTINKDALLGEPINNGKIVYDFSTADESSWIGFSTNNTFNVTHVHPGINNGYSLTSAPRRFHEYYISLQSNWNKAMLSNKSFYALNNNQYQLVSKENYVYKDTLITRLTGLKVIPFVKLASTYSSVIDYYNSGINSFYNYSTYEISCGNKILKEKITTNYEQNGQVKTEVKYNYNADLQLAREELIGSDGSSIITKYRYPIDFGIISGSDDISKGIKRLTTENVMNPVVEKWVERKPLSGSTHLINAVFTSYKPDRPLPDKMFVVEAAEPITNFQTAANVNGTVRVDNRYSLKLNLNKYNLNGRLLEQKIENGLTTSYAWSYNGQYPIAEIRNSKATEFAFSNFETPGDLVPEEDPENWMVTMMPGAQSTFYSWFSGTGYTGNRSFRGPALVSKLVPQGDYMLVFFAKGNGNIKINNVDQPINSSGWRKYNFPLSGIKGVTITNPNGILIDDLLLSRRDIQITSYTYEPLVGITSETDAKGVVTYYEYDGSHRLKAIKDHKRQIIKSFTYNYRTPFIN